MAASALSQRRPARQRATSRSTAGGGYSLTEVLVALLLTSLLLVALGRVLATVSRTLQWRDSQAEMRERARFALAILEPDIQMAGYYGLTSRGTDFRWLQSGDAAGAAAPAALSQSAPPLASTPAVTHDCGVNYALDLAVPLQADNNRFALGRHRTGGCAASGGARRGTDTVTVRRAATTAAAADPGRFQLLVDRSDERRRWILADGTAPAGVISAADRLEWHDLQLDIYYISNDSVGAPGTPALRVKSLTRVSGRPTFVDTEVMPGIEDMQLQLVTDAGVFDPETLPLNAAIRMVQLWLRVRAMSTEAGYRDTQGYRYADVDSVPSAAEQGFRRLLVSRRIALRNATP